MALRDLIGGGPTALVAGKVADRLNDICRRSIVPGVGETFRVNGSATLVDDTALRETPQEYERARADRHRRGEGLY